MNARLSNRQIEEQLIIAEFAVPREFAFQPGEYVQIILPGGLKRYFSVASSPSQQGTVRIATRPSHSEFKKILAAMPLGTDVEIKGPWGDMVLPKDESVKLTFVAGGIGITPFLSMLSELVSQRSERDVQLLHFTDDKIFEDELRDYIANLPNGKMDVIYERINPEIIKMKIPDYQTRTFFLAAPPGFVNVATAILQELQIPNRQTIGESYTGY